MAIRIDKLDLVENEIERFLKKAKSARKRLLNDEYAHFGCKETASVRRASMDLSRALSYFRKTE